MKLLKDIPGFEHGELHCIACSDKLDKIFFAGNLIAELRGRYCTSVAYFSTQGTAKEIEAFLQDRSGQVGALYAIDLEDKDCRALYERATEIIRKKFVRAIIIDCLEGLDITDFDGGIRAKRKEIELEMHLLARTENVPVLLFCPKMKLKKDIDSTYIIDPMGDILPQMRQWKINHKQD